MGQSHCTGAPTPTEEQKRLFLEQAIEKKNTLLCHEILQDFDVNTRVGHNNDTALTLAVKSNNIKMVKFLLRYENSDENKTEALEFAVKYSGKTVSFEIMKCLIYAGAYTTSPMVFCEFFKDHRNNPKLRKEFVYTICEHVRIYRLNRYNLATQRYRLLGSLLKMATVISCNLGFSGLPRNHQFINGWGAYRLIHCLMMHGANAESFWDPLFRDYLTVRDINCISYSQLNMAYLNIAIFILFLRTSTGKSIPLKVDLMLYHYTNFYSKYEVCANVIDNMDLIMKVIVLSGVPLQKSKMYFLGKHQQVTSPCRYKREALSKIGAACDKVKIATLPLTLQQCCCLGVQQNIRGPNLLYTLNTMKSIPTSIKDILLMENVEEVRFLEHIG